MFKHKQSLSPLPPPSAPSTADDSGTLTVEEKIFKGTRPGVPKDVSPQALRELMEKNLKWSQIIYEQNRRINSKLFWAAFASWFKIIIFIVLTGATLFLVSPLVRQMVGAYNSIVGGNSSWKLNNNPTASSPDQLLHLLPITDAQREELKQLFNKK